MTDRIRRYGQYAASKKVPAMIAAPFYLRILWALGIDAKPGILSNNLVVPALELAIKVSLVVTPLSLLAIWPTSRYFYTEPFYFFVSIASMTLFVLPGCYLAVKGHRKQLGINCWKDF